MLYMYMWLAFWLVSHLNRADLNSRWFYVGCSTLSRVKTFGALLMMALWSFHGPMSEKPDPLGWQFDGYLQGQHSFHSEVFCVNTEEVDPLTG